MKIKQKTILIFGFSLLCLSVAIWMVIGHITEKSFAELEARSAEQHIRRIEILYDSAVATLDTMLVDWARWDDSYYFVQGQKPDYPAVNLLDATLVSNDLNMMIFVNTDREVVYAKFIDLDAKKEAPFPDDVRQQITSRAKLMTHATAESAVSGIVVTGSGPVELCSRPILPSVQKGPVKGTLIFGKMLNAARIERFANKSLANLTLYNLHDPSDKAALSAVLPHLTSDRSIYIERVSEDEVRSYVRVDDVDGREALVLQSALPRDVYRQGKLLRTLLIVALLVVAVAIFVILLFLLDSQILSKLTFFQKKVQDIAAQGTTDVRVNIRGADEIVALANSFNHMLDVIDENSRTLSRAKKTAEEANIMKTEFLSNVSHEIRTPLNSILGFAEVIVRLENIAEAREKARIILQESEILMQLLNTLLDHAKIEAGKMELEYGRLDIRAVLRSVKTSLQVQADKKGIDFTVNVGSDVPQCFIGDGFRVRQVIINLAANAVKFTSEGSVTISVDRIETQGEKETLRFMVEDTGIGIDEADQKKIFEAFVQADGSMTRKYGGSGLGVAIAKKLVTMMGGELCVTSAIGTGAKFWFDLQVNKCQDEEPVPGVEEEASFVGRDLSDKRILLAEDYVPNQQLVTLHLQALKAVVDVVSDGEEAIAICDKQRYDLILMDVQMPKVDGYQATRVIRQQSKFCRESAIVIMTAHAGMEVRRQSAEAGADDIIAKPIRRNIFLNVVLAILTKGPGAQRQQVSSAAAAEAPSGAVPDIDFPGLIDECGGDQVLAAASLRTFVATVEQQIGTIRQAVAANDMKVFQAELHKIKGAAGMLRLNALTAKTVRMNALLKNAQYDEALSLVDGFIREFEAVKAFVAGRKTE